mgnify:CR=1 FL=1
MKKTLTALLIACVVFGAAAAFAHDNQERREHFNQQQANHPRLNWQDNQPCDGNNEVREHRNQQMMNHPEFNRQPGMPGMFGPHERHCRNGHRGMNFTPDMPKEIREKAAELAKLRVDLEEAMSSDPVNKAKALDTYSKMQKVEQEIKMWRFTQRLERLEEFKKQMKLNKNVPPAPSAPKEDAKDAPAK